MSSLSETLGLKFPNRLKVFVRPTGGSSLVESRSGFDADSRAALEADRRATVEAVARWLEREAMRVEALAVEADTDKRDWQEANSLRAGARSLRSTLGHLRRELLAAPEEGRDG